MLIIAPQNDRGNGTKYPIHVILEDYKGGPVEVPLANLDYPQNYRQWAGCFSVLPDNYFSNVIYVKRVYGLYGDFYGELPLHNQASFREWPGCYTLLSDHYFKGENHVN